uniref:Uncharacterized protein n=1 Tax=Arundo donax TaxID=35708 RepID=A0A0A9G5H9_ARUDO
MARPRSGARWASLFT